MIHMGLMSLRSRFRVESGKRVREKRENQMGEVREKSINTVTIIKTNIYSALDGLI